MRRLAAQSTIAGVPEHRPGNNWAVVRQSPRNYVRATILAVKAECSVAPPEGSTEPAATTVFVWWSNPSPESLDDIGTPSLGWHGMAYFALQTAKIANATPGMPSHVAALASPQT